MRILLDTTFALRGLSGTGVYLARLTDALRAAGVEVVEAAHERRPRPAGGGLRSARNLALDAAWTQVELPRLARRTGADLLHHPLPALSRRTGCPQVVTVHDLAFERMPEHFAPAFRAWASRAHRAAARGADAVVCVSETTRLDVMARWGVPAERIVVARHGPGQEPDHLAREGSHARHFLYVGDEEPRKNLGLLLDAYARYRARSDGVALPLVLAGSASSAGEGVELVAKPDSDRLARLYADAAALVHPALHEGFGLTVLEAMSAGVPVLAARSPGLAETCGDAACYIDPYDAGALAAELGRLAADAGLRHDLAERGRRQAAEFSWARSARRHIEAYSLATA